ncbi:hypothetical protein ACFPU0_13235 [Pseudomonas sp. GCM10022186]|uniref:hypothetical protein n=1 Tax=Pseudomonas sp. GCM10022186 TaxID=3252650 RepID=UPI00360B0D9B
MTLQPYLVVYKNTYYTGIVWLSREPKVMKAGFTAVLVNVAVATQFEVLLDRRRGNWIPVDEFKPRLI